MVWLGFIYRLLCDLIMLSLNICGHVSLTPKRKTLIRSLLHSLLFRFIPFQTDRLGIFLRI